MNDKSLIKRVLRALLRGLATARAPRPNVVDRIDLGGRGGVDGGDGDGVGVGSAVLIGRGGKGGRSQP